MAEDEKDATSLDRRTPQASEGATIDRRLNCSGRVTIAELNQDVDLMKRIRDRLLNL